MSRRQGTSSPSHRRKSGPPPKERPWFWRLAVPVVALLGFILISAIGYRIIQPQFDWLDATYMSIITVTTVGHGEVHPLTVAGRQWTIFVTIGGVTLNAIVVTGVVAMLVEGRVRDLFGRNHVQREISRLSEHVIIAGYGRMGSLIAEQLVEAGSQIVVIDHDGERIAAAERAGLLPVLGDAQEDATLRSAGIEQAKTLIATLKDDADNVFVTLSARQANASLGIIVRAQQASTEPMLLKAGATRVVCPQIIGATRMADVVIRPAVVDFVEMSHKGLELEMDQLRLSEGGKLIGRTLEELALPRRIGVVVVAVLRADGSAIYQPRPETRLQAGDTLVVVGRKGMATAVQEMEESLS